MPNIIDVIKHKNAYGYQWFAVIDREPLFLYERHDDILFAEDDGFFNAYRYQTPVRGWKAFAGREFDISMTDGSVVRADGQWWSCLPGSLCGVETQSMGCATIAELEKCYVFTNANISKQKIDDWLAANEPATDYYKYEKRRLEQTPQTKLTT